MIEEQIFVVGESAFEYFCHFKTDSGSSRKIVSSSIKVMDNRNVDLSKLAVMEWNSRKCWTYRGVICLMELHAVFVKTVALVCLPDSCKFLLFNDHVICLNI